MARPLVAVLLTVALALAGAQFTNRYATALTDDTIQDAIERGPVLLCVCVPFMGACKEFHPRWEEVARRIKEAGKGVLVATLDLWSNHVSKVRFDAKDMPWILLLKGQCARCMLKRAEADTPVRLHRWQVLPLPYDGSGARQVAGGGGVTSGVRRNGRHRP